MSSVTIQIEIPPESQALIRSVDALPEQIPQAIKRGMDRALRDVNALIQQRRLTGRGPFPPSLHQLGVRRGQLRLRTRATPATIRGNVIEGKIGTDVIYGRVHEFGFQGTVRYRTKTGKTASRRMNMPERAPFRTGIDENKEYIATEIADEIEKTFKK